MNVSLGRSVRALLACATALLAGGVLIRHQASCAGCQPGHFAYDDPVGCDASCHVLYSGKLTGTCNSDCEASVLQGRCVGTKGSCIFHRDWAVKICSGPPVPPPAPTSTAAPIPTNTAAPEPSTAPTSTLAASSTPAPTGSALPSVTSWPLPTHTAVPSPSTTPQPTDTPRPTASPTDTPVPTPPLRPPELTSMVSCSLPGNAGWCRAGATLRLQASDPQGLGVVIHGELNGRPFQCGPTCSLTLPEGRGAANFEAVSDSGMTTSGSVSWKLDSAPPAIASKLEGGTQGKNGWYMAGPVSLACIATDATSGLALILYKVDQGPWGNEDAAQSDGAHNLGCRAVDVAGNASQAQEEVKIDSQPPVTQFKLSQGVWLAGAVSIRGTTVDAGSGLADIEFALDGQTRWICLGSSSNWSYSWDTRGSSDGTHTLYARGEDMAGNVENPKAVSVRVDNTPPQVTMAPSWNLGQVGRFAAEDGGVGIGTVRAVFSGNGIRPREVDYAQPPSEIAWDGIDGSGRPVGYGDYQVSVTVCDLLRNCATAQAQIHNPAPPRPGPTKPHPSATSTSTPTPTATSNSTVTPTATWILALPSRPARSMALVQPEGTPPPKVEVMHAEHWIIWPFVGLLGLILAIGATYALDGRAQELRKLRRDLQLVFISSLENHFEAITKGER